MDTLTVRDLRERTGELIRDAESGKLSVIIGLNVIGTCGLLLEARRGNLIEAPRSPVEKLAKSGYNLSEPPIDSVSRMTGEP